MLTAIAAIRPVGLVLIAGAVLAACATSPTGRRQLELFSATEMARMGDAAYRQVQAQTPPARDSRIIRYVDCVARNLLTVTPPPVGADRWRVSIFQRDESANAFALPGGNIGIYTGIFRAARNQHQLAAVIAHEVAHVQAEHHNARLSTQYATDAALQVIAAVAGDPASPDNQRVLSLLGLGAQVGLILPFSRAQETEADVLGLRYMARAGFDPRETIALWRNMATLGGPRPPEFLSTHPAGQSRIDELNRQIPQALRLYQQAQAQGRRPQCRLQ